MKLNSTHRRVMAITVLLAFVLPALAVAYIDPWDFLAKQVAQTNRHWQGFQLELDQTLYDGTGQTSAHHKIALSLKRPQALLLEQDDTILARVRGGQEDGAFKALSNDIQSLLRLWLSLGDATRMTALLASWEIPQDPRGLGRLDETICYIVGSTEGNEDRNQLWLEKWTFKPARIFKVNKQGEITVDVRLYKNDGVITEGDLPERIDFYRNGKLAERWQVRHYRRATLNSTWLSL